jgi:hypothetical protein
MKTRLIPVLVVALSCSNLPIVRASPPPAPSTADVERAKERFQKGVTLFKERSFDAALAEFQKAYELAPDYRLLYNLAQIQMERHDYVNALARFRDYLRYGGSQLTAERRGEVEREITGLLGLVAELSVSVDPQGAELFVDGVRAGTLPMSQPELINAGVRTIQVRKVGYAPHQQTITVAGGETQRLEVTLQPESRLAIRSEAPSQERASHASIVRDRAPFWISLVATAAFGATSAVMAIATVDKKSDFERDLGAFPANLQQIDSDRSKLKLYAGLTDAFGAAALVSAGCLVYFVLSGSSPAGETKSQSLRVGPGTGGPGVSVFGNF